jgi:hypothetical protein
MSLEGGLEQPTSASLGLSTFHGCIDGVAELGRTYCCLGGLFGAFCSQREAPRTRTLGWTDGRR